MPNTRIYYRSFAGGEIGEGFLGRIDDIKYQTGLALCRNFIPLPHGEVVNRTGTYKIKEVKDSSKKTRVIDFRFGDTQNFCIEMGAGYFRWHINGQTLLAGTPAAWSNSTAYALGNLVSRNGVNYYCIATNTNITPPNTSYWYALPLDGTYEIPNPFSESDLMDIHKVQSADVLTLVHKNYPPQELRRYGATDWRLVPISFSPSLVAPTNVVATATGTGGTPISHSYKITSVGSTGLEESYVSTVATCSNDLLNSGHYNTITWSASSGASRYNIYKQDNGLFGYLGQTDALSFVDDNINPDISKTPPQPNNPFVGSGNYPNAISYHEQRRCFGGTINKPDSLWMTRSGTENDLSFSIPTRDDDAISIKIRARESNEIRHIVPLGNLVLLTSSTEWYITSVNSDAITPTSIAVKPQSYIGASTVEPVLVNNNLIFCAARGGHVRELAYASEASGYITGDLSLRHPNLFNNKTIIDMALQKSFDQIVWFVSSDGNLLGLTYIPEQQVSGWHVHETDGNFESVCTVPEGSDDSIYVVVKRTINNQIKRFIEVFSTRLFDSVEDSHYVDCGSVYSGAPADEISGLDYLEGKTVSILADGAVHRRLTVSNGKINLDYNASKVHIGLPITANLKTLPAAVQMESFGQGRTKNVNKIWVKVESSRGIMAGPNFDRLVEYKQRTNEPYGSPPNLKTGEIEIMIPSNWSQDGSICVQQADPLPLRILSMTLELSIGG